MRYKALVDGGIDVAIMTPPHDLLCSPAGFTELADAARYLPKYQGVVGTCLQGSRPKPFLNQYKAALVKGLLWLRDSGNRAAAIDIIRDHLQVEGDAKMFSDLYDSMLSRTRGGFDLGGSIDPEGLERVASLRKEFSRTASLRPISEYLLPA